MIAGDATPDAGVAGAGYNSGIRDAFNLGWKLAAVVNGQAGDSLLDTYDVERRKHARAMIDLSTMVGRVISPTNRRCCEPAGQVIRAASVVPTLKSYVPDAVQTDAALRARRGGTRADPARAGIGGRHLFIQPRWTPVNSRTSCSRCHRARVRGAVLEQRPRRLLWRRRVHPLESLGRQVHPHCGPRPSCIWDAQGGPDPDVTVVGDRTGARSRSSSTPRPTVLFLRPDRCVAGACIAQRAPELSADLARALALSGKAGESHGETGSVLHVAQPTAEPSGSVG